MPQLLISVSNIELKANAPVQLSVIVDSMLINQADKSSNPHATSNTSLHSICGASQSSTNTLKSQLASLPLPSSIVYSIVLIPRLNTTLSAATVFVPLDDELPVVSPLISYVKVNPSQFSLNKGSVWSSDNHVHPPASVQTTT